MSLAARAVLLPPHQPCSHKHTHTGIMLTRLARGGCARSAHARAKPLCRPPATCACQPSLSGWGAAVPPLSSGSAAAGQLGGRCKQPRITLMVAWWPAHHHLLPSGAPQSPPAAGRLGLGAACDPSQRSEQPASPGHSGAPGDGGAEGRPAFCFQAGAAPGPLGPAMRMPAAGCASPARGRGGRRRALVRGGLEAAREAAWLAGFQGPGEGCDVRDEGRDGAAWEHPETIQQAWVQSAGCRELQLCVCTERTQGAEGHAKRGQADGEAGVRQRHRSRYCGACVPLPGLRYFLRSASEVTGAYGLHGGP